MDKLCKNLNKLAKLTEIQHLQPKFGQRLDLLVHSISLVVRQEAFSEEHDEDLNFKW